MKKFTHSFERALLYIMSAAVICLSVFTINDRLVKSEVAYVDISKLAENYELKKDLEKMAGKNLYHIKSVIDSLKMASGVANAQGSMIDTQLANAEYAFQQYYTQSNQQINKEIWERLNPIIAEYGKERNLEILIGANGSGSLLYANNERDLTADLTNYVNEKYGKNR